MFSIALKDTLQHLQVGIPLQMFSG